MTPLVEHPKRIVFVCVENSNRSQIAEAFARLHGGARRSVQRRFPAVGEGEPARRGVHARGGVTT